MKSKVVVYGFAALCILAAVAVQKISSEPKLRHTADGTHQSEGKEQADWSLTLDYGAHCHGDGEGKGYEP